MQDAQDLVGQTIGEYTVEGVLGQGGFAWVFRARSGSGST